MSCLHGITTPFSSKKCIKLSSDNIQTIDSAHSDDYYWNFHKYVLDLAPGYDYDSHYLEDRFPALLIALFENPGYKKAVLDKGTYADPSDYEKAKQLLKKKGIAMYFLSGSISVKDLIDMMYSFNNGIGTDVFLISLKAGGTGLNLIGVDTVIHLDPWWNVAAEKQASDRTHRIGQTRNVKVIKQVISDDDGSVTSASLEDIAFVLD